MKKRPLAILLLCFVIVAAGCSEKKEIEETIETTKAEKHIEIQEELVPLEMDFEDVEDFLVPKVVIRRVNMTQNLSEAYYEYPEVMTGEFSELSAALEEFRETRRVWYLESLQEEFPAGKFFMEEYAYHILPMEMTLCNEQFVSFKMTENTYNGFANHEMAWRGGATFLTATGERMTLDMLGDVKSDIYDFILAKFGYNQHGGYWQDYETIVAELLEKDDRWFLTPDGIGIEFSDCEISSYSWGAPAVLVPYDKLPGLKAEYRWKEDIMPKENLDWETQTGIPLLEKVTWEYPSSTELFSGNYTGVRYVGAKYPKLKEALDVYYQESVTQYAQEAKKREETRMHEDVHRDAEYSEYAVVTKKSPQVVSVKMTRFEHTGRLMEEGDCIYQGITFDVNTGEILTLDMLGNIKEESYQYLLNYLEENYSSDTGWLLVSEYPEIVRKSLEEETIWSLTDSGICFWFGDGVLGKWRFSVEIPYGELSGLAEEYQKVMLPS